MKFKVLILALAILFNRCDEKSMSIHVSPTGADANMGTMDAPVATLTKAQTLVREALGNEYTGDISVVLSGGVYRLDETLVLGLKDGAGEGQTISWEAAEGAEPIITSTKVLSGWQKLASPPEALPAIAHGNVYVLDLNNQGPDKWNFKTLYDGETLLPRARSKGFQPTTACPNPTLANRWEDLQILHYPEGVIKDWPNLSDVEIFIRPTHQWLVNYLTLESVDEENLLATTTLPGTYRLCQVKNKPWKETCWVENVLEALDQPGEWVLDSQAGKLYLWPTGDTPGDNIQAPTLPTLVRVEGKNVYEVKGDIPVRGIQFKGLTFTGTDRDTWTKEDRGIQHDWDMFDKDNTLLRFRSAQDCRVIACDFRNAGSGGIRIDLYGQNIEIRSNKIDNLGGTGILLAGYGPGVKDVNYGHSIVDNEMSRIGQLYLHSPGIFIWQSGENKVLNNYIHDLPYDAIVLSGVRPRYFGIMDSVKWTGYAIPRRIRENMQIIRWEETDDPQTAEEALKFAHARNNVVQDNEFHNVMEVLGDGNAIYLSCAGKGNIIKRNLIYKTTKASNEIRFDDDQEESYVEQNIVFGNGIKLKHTNYILNNIVIGGGISIRPETVVGAKVNKNIIYGIGTPVRFYNTNVEKKLKGLLDLANPDYNLFYSDMQEAGKKSLEQIQALGHEAHGVYADPLFKDMARGDVRLEEGSPALAMGIESIDIMKIGLLSQPSFERIWKNNIELWSAETLEDHSGENLQLVK
ncbi:MAG: right-handed parallel beta-helix repeat-containing protein [Candidatus Marinimicrobia bacterium]|jgi:hypothetical protein|nr:right-handed parallel beta-helix repeat-containing protein [Candidatus Neomarinimicrobiota bacterium]MBT3823622.1 right-handed parallel beta-helix repeat-containing protein [Candidatus Neomarinimicrobiota bacterium]MBT4129519.1 right-handed parallel beta-helix repeat-containing protein [Candidatus Neomarinimicrobiota bacterium]MBT4295955.1 right-handed parallel beta-helix repeat-containing protein [Candidatus Neomarinimicrobiota bacterium]MBT4420043.1 right-handed parallel beta-helix repeat-